MKDHKIIPEKLYPVSIPDEPEPIYPHIEIPAEVFKGYDCKIGEEYTIDLKIKVRRMDEYSYGCDLQESDVETTEEA